MTFSFTPNCVALTWDGTNADAIVSMIETYNNFPPNQMDVTHGETLSPSYPPDSLIIQPPPDGGFMVYVYAYNHGDVVFCTPWQLAASMPATDFARYYTQV